MAIEHRGGGYANAAILVAKHLHQRADRPRVANPGERLAIICVLMVGFAFTSNFVYALVGSLLRQWLAQGRRLLWFNRVLALVLAATAAWMLAV